MKEDLFSSEVCERLARELVTEQAEPLIYEGDRCSMLEDLMVY